MTSSVFCSKLYTFVVSVAAKCRINTMVKKVKISGVKRSQHIKHKKNFARPGKKKDNVKNTKVSEKQLATSKKVFGKPIGQKPNKRKDQQVDAIQNGTGPKKGKKGKNFAQSEKSIENGHSGSNENEMNEEDLRDLLDMIEDEDDELLNRSKKRKRDAEQAGDDEAGQFEQEYAHQRNAEKSKKVRTVDLLPIKTKSGELITRSTEVEVKEKPKVVTEEEEESEEEEVVDSDDDIVNDLQDEQIDLAAAAKDKAISTADLLILRDQEINRQKYRIGIICSGILEKPEDKMKNFNALFELMDERHNDTPNLFSVRKIATMSLLEVFKDILPEYRIGQIDLKTQKVKKTTMERVTYEDALLMHYKKYLQKLEKLTSGISKGQRKTSQEYRKMAEIATTCLCELVVAHPYFNFAQNIAQLLVYLSNCNIMVIRTRVMECFQQLFREDSKFDLSLFVVRRLNHLIKSKSNMVHVEVLRCLLALQIKSINLDDEKEKELKQKKMEAQKSRLINMSKKERKRMKKLKEVEKELQEAKAEENKQTKTYKLTEITKMVFTIFFRILKNDPSSQLLSACLEGLAEFAHTINLDFFSDLVEVLNHIMETAELGYREQLHCVQTVFTILSGQGEVLNIDPLRFYGHLYRNLLVCSAGKNHDDFQIILKTLIEVLVKRRKNISQSRMMAFIKRIMILSLQLLSNGTVASLGIVKSVMQATSSLEILLDTDTSIGSGKYDAELDDPEFCNANCTALYELAALLRHYHPIVRKVANHIAHGVPATGEGSLAPEISKLTPIEWFQKFDCSEMSFDPPISPPKPVDLNKPIKGRFYYLNEDVEIAANQSLATTLKSQGHLLDFYKEIRSSSTNKNNQ